MNSRQDKEFFQDLDRIRIYWQNIHLWSHCVTVSPRKLLAGAGDDVPLRRGTHYDLYLGLASVYIFSPHHGPPQASHSLKLRSI